MFDYRGKDGQKENYYWTQKIQKFNSLIYSQHLLVADLSIEFQALAYESASYSINLLIEFQRKFPLEVSSIEDSQAREKLFCTKLWDWLSYLITDPNEIYATPPEKKRLLHSTDLCVKECFIKNLTRKERYINMEKSRLGILGRQYTLEELEKVYEKGTRKSEKPPSGYYNEGWLKLKKYCRPTDEWWDFRTPEPSWEFLAGAEGIALVRDGYIIGDLTTCMS